jgi:hypothetical protein
MWDLLGKIAGVKQGSGIVGKLCSAALLAFGAMGVAAYSISIGGWTAAAGLAAVLVIAGTFLRFVSGMLDHAKKDRFGAGMDSGDLLQYSIRELEIAQSNGAASVPTANVAPSQVEQVQVAPPQAEQVVVVEERPQ